MSAPNDEHVRITTTLLESEARDLMRMGDIAPDSGTGAKTVASTSRSMLRFALDHEDQYLQWMMEQYL